MYWKYLKYVIRHKWFVFLECCKFRPSEFIPYARYFYGNYPDYWEKIKGLCTQDIKQRFDKAWLLHIHRNPHHWQYWILREDNPVFIGKSKIIPMPVKYLKEMLADWHGAGQAINGKNNPPNGILKTGIRSN